MTTALVLKSGVTGNCYAPFGSGGGVGDRPADHNLGTLLSKYAGSNPQPFDNTLSYNPALTRAPHTESRRTNSTTTAKQARPYTPSPKESTLSSGRTTYSSMKA
jgi:hypothetical protein